MKRFALSMIALALASSMVFAEDAAPALKLTGYLNTGIKTSIIGDKVTSQLYGSDADVDSGRFQLNGTYANADSGVTFRLRADTITFSAFTFKYAYAWSNLLDKQVTVKAGLVDDGTFTTSGDAGFDFDPTGILVAYKPVAGLALGVSYFVPKTAATASSPLTYAFQGAYTADKLTKVAGGVKVADAKVAQINVGASLLAVDKLTAAVEAKILNPADYSSKGATVADQLVTYGVTDALTVGVVAYEYLFGSDIKFIDGKTLLGYTVKPNVSYTVDPVISVAGGVKYGTGSTDTDVVANDAAYIEVDPAVTFVVAPSASIVAGYTVDYSLDKDKLAYGPSKAAVANTIKVDFQYKF